MSMPVTATSPSMPGSARESFSAVMKASSASVESSSNASRSRRNRWKCQPLP